MFNVVMILTTALWMVLLMISMFLEATAIYKLDDEYGVKKRHMNNFGIMFVLLLYMLLSSIMFFENMRYEEVCKKNGLYVKAGKNVLGYSVYVLKDVKATDTVELDTK